MQQLTGRAFPFGNCTVGAPNRVCSLSPTFAAPRRHTLCVHAYVETNKNWHQLPLKHVVDSSQFNRDALEAIFAESMMMEKVRPGTPQAKMLDGFIMSTLFYEPSTRTRLSFESAVARLGGQILSTESAGEYSSAAKGETLEGKVGVWGIYAR